jgi:hypothetical protein
MGAKHRLRCLAALTALEVAVRLVRLAARAAPAEYAAAIAITMGEDGDLAADLDEIRIGGW